VTTKICDNNILEAPHLALLSENSQITQTICNQKLSYKRPCRFFQLVSLPPEETTLAWIAISE
jgi:hypothetical protein